MDYASYIDKSASQKIVLATIDATTRLMGWSVLSGSVYQYTNFTEKIITSLKENTLDSVDDLVNAPAKLGAPGTLSAGEYVLNTVTNILYMRSYDSVNPNTLFVSVDVRFFFATQPVTLSYDLDTGVEVFWRPILKDSSEFGTTIDTINQMSEAITGTGSINLVNDPQFWPDNFEKWAWENKSATIYSYTPGLDLAEIKILFDGRTGKKKYSPQTVSLSLNDKIDKLRVNIPLALVSELDLRAGDDQDQYFQRMIFGRVFGHKPTNVSRQLDGYPLTGTASGALTETSPDVFEYVLTFTSTLFLDEVSPDDKLLINGFEVDVATVVSNTSITLKDPFPGVQSFSGELIYSNPDTPRKYMNRTWNVCGHVVREPVTTTETDSTIDTIHVEDTRDFYPGDYIYVGTEGSGELTRIANISGSHYIQLSISLATAPSFGVTVKRPAVQNVKIDNIMLQYYRDYSFDAETGTLTLNQTAEKNAVPLKTFPTNLTFNGTRVVTGTGLDKLETGWWVGIFGQVAMYEILSIDSPTQLTLRTTAAFSGTAQGRYKDIIFDEDNNILSLDVLGLTLEGTTEGTLIKTAPAISKYLLKLSGITDDGLDIDSFSNADNISYFELGIAIPEKQDDTETPIYTDTLNTINKSAFGAVVVKYDTDVKIRYKILQPNKNIETTVRFKEHDILNFNMDANAENTASKIIVKYLKKEYDPVVESETFKTYEKISKNAKFLSETLKEKTVETQITNEAHARIVACRWSFIAGDSLGRFSFDTKLRGSALNVGDIIEIEHVKLFSRMGVNTKRRLFLVETVKKNGFGTAIECADLGNAFNKVACISEITDNWDAATDDEKLYCGFYTDGNGMQDNDSKTFNTNLIW